MNQKLGLDGFWDDLARIRAALPDVVGSGVGSPHPALTLDVTLDDIMDIGALTQILSADAAIAEGDLWIADANPNMTILPHPGSAYQHLETDGTTAAWQVNLTMADDAWIGLTGPAGRLIFDSTPAPDQVQIADADFYINTGLGIIHADGVGAGPPRQLLIADGTRYIPGTLAATDLAAHDILSTQHGDTLAAAVSQGSLIYGNATPAWAELVHPGATGYAFITTGAATLAWDDTPAWINTHSFAAGITFNGASGANEITVPDDAAIAMELLDAGGIEYLRIVSTNAQPSIGFNDGGADIDVVFSTAAHVDAFSIRGSDSQYTLGAFGAGVVQSDAGGILSSGTIDTGDISDLAYGTPALTFTTANAAGAANTVMRTDASLAIFDANNPTQIDAGDVAGTGAAAFAARRDHAHAVNSTADGATNHSTLLQSNASGQLTVDDLFVPDGGQFGISGNELLTVNAAGNFTFSGVTSVVVPNGAWVGADANASWVFDTSNNDVTTLDSVGIGIAAPSFKTHIFNTAFDTLRLERSTDAAGVLVSFENAGGVLGGIGALDGGGGELTFRVGGVASGDTAMYIDNGGAVFINDTTNTDMTIGLTINQGANDDELLAGKSSDVAHGMTDFAETDSYFTVSKHSGVAGGALVRGYRDANDTANRALVLQGFLAEDADTDKTNAGVGIVNVGGFIRDAGDPADRGNTNSGGNVFSVRTLEGGGIVTLFIVGEGADVDIPNGRVATGHGDYWDLEDYHAGAPSATGYVRVDINGTTYELLAST